MIRFGPAVCTDLARASSREWLETNGIGGFASSTITGLNTRRYHGLLVAATRPPVGRMVLLSKLEETVVVDGRRIELAANRYPGVVHPDGYRHLCEFALDPFPVAIYRIAGLTLTKTVFMVHGANTTVVEYQLMAAGSAAPVTLELRPLVAFRDYHALTHENGALDPHVEIQSSVCSVRPYPDLPPLHLSHGDGRVMRTGEWYRRFEYDQERARGLDFVEDLFNPCVMRFELGVGATVTILASTEPIDRARGLEARRAEIARRRAAPGTTATSTTASGNAATGNTATGTATTGTTVAAVAAVPAAPLARALGDAADRFVVRRAHGQTVIAGYHWFSDWGRDTMIALPGLTRHAGHAEGARGILSEFLRHADRGLIPNRFPDAGPPEYTSADATLWLFHAVQMCMGAPDDDGFVRREMYGRLGAIVDWHVRGTRHNIHVDDDGLLIAGPAAVPLTWMDVRIGDWMPTPRFGKAVEVQALWYNALRFMAQLAGRYGDDSRSRHCTELAALAQRSFNRLFWNAGSGCLHDVVDGDVRDGSLRPNQVIAVSLPFTMLSRRKAISVLGVVERTLLTPYGLRTLAPDDPHYQGRYEGDARHRDGAYHQGTVWPWLFGPFATAYLRLQPTARARAVVQGWLQPFAAHLEEAGLGQVSEIFDGDAPHRPAGCIAQAWSVAELLRVSRMVEDRR
jgi:glycogen debranching enzyme